LKQAGGKGYIKRVDRRHELPFSPPSSQLHILETDFLLSEAHSIFALKHLPKTSLKMKFTAILAFALAGIALASPVAEPELVKRE
jgi:hypothetical protein